MVETRRWSRILVITGLAIAILGAVDPLEGSVVIVAGIGMITLGAFIGKSPKKKLLSWSLVLVVVGVAALWGLSALGGFGGGSGRSLWWGLVLLPYPVGWIMGLVGGIGCLREARAASGASGLDDSERNKTTE